MWTQLLDRVQVPAQLDSLNIDDIAAAFAAELPPATSLADFEARDAVFIAALRSIDGFLGRAMRIRLDHALATDVSIPPVTRKVFASTVGNYASDLSLLRERAFDVAQRGGAREPNTIADAVTECARSTLDLASTLQARILDTVRDHAKPDIAIADRNARDRNRDERERKRWSALRRDLEAIVADPGRTLMSGAFATRLATQPEQLDEPEPEREPTLAELIELD